jgi:D-arabinose 1-dehydrogenase-like Zn-dependent alcohol dehydrogenase
MQEKEMVNIMAEKMQGMVLTKLAPIETRPLELMSIGKPKINSESGLLLEIEACGVCRVKPAPYRRRLEKYGAPSSLPAVPGHEIVGIVKKRGDSVKKKSR